MGWQGFCRWKKVTLLCYSIPFRNACLHVAVQLPYRHFGTVLNNAYNKYSQGTRSGGTAEVFVAIKATKRMEFKGLAQIFSDYVFTPPQHTEPELHVKTVLQHSPEQFIYMFKKTKKKKKNMNWLHAALSSVILSSF